MPILCDFIEEYLKSLLQEAGGQSIEVQRGELADRFGCAPSQINYVLSTRFTPAHGYSVESRRGGGGYIRLIRLRLKDQGKLARLLSEQLGERISQEGAFGLIGWLAQDNLISEREARLMRAVVLREAIGLELPLRDMVRARLLRAMLVSIMRPEEA